MKSWRQSLPSLRAERLNRGNFNRYTKRPLQDSAIIFSTPGMGGSAFYCANHRVSCKCQQPPGWKIHSFFRWKMPFAVFRSGSGVSDWKIQDHPPGLKFSNKIDNFKRATHQTPFFGGGGEFWRSRLKLSSEIQFLKRDWNFQARQKMFSLCALRVCNPPPPAF